MPTAVDGAIADTHGMPVRLIFRCQFCDAQPDPLTQLNLEKAMRENTWGAYQNALPENWLVFHGRGLYGSPRYACAEHRGDLVAHLREHFGTIGAHVWKRPPYPSSLAHADTDHAWIAATRRQGSSW
jgi:hypothetical protein